MVVGGLVLLGSGFFGDGTGIGKGDSLGVGSGVGDIVGVVLGMGIGLGDAEGSVLGIGVDDGITGFGNVDGDGTPIGT